MTFDKLPLSSSSLARSGSVLSALVIATFLFAGSLTTVQQTAATTLTGPEQEILDTQDESTENLSESDRDVNGIEFTPRWGGVATLQPNQINVLFADCLEDEFAVSYMYMFETEDVVAFNSFPWAFPDDHMSWLAIVKNTDTNNARVASIGVICADENSGREDDINIDIRVKNKIQTTVNNFINIQNNQITNLNVIANTYQQITQNAINIAIVSGNNNTVEQVIDQTATNILNANTTSPEAIQQTIDQDARNAGVISGGATLSQAIDQNAANEADVTDGGGNATTIDQAIGQNATNEADVESGLGSTVDQAIDQNAANEADVTDGGGNATTIDQAIGQNATNEADVESGLGSTIDQAIGQNAANEANVEEEE